MHSQQMSYAGNKYTHISYITYESSQGRRHQHSPLLYIVLTTTTTTTITSIITIISFAIAAISRLMGGLGVAIRVHEHIFTITTLY